MRQFWAVLGIEPTKDVKTIKIAYAKASKQYHPEEFPKEFKRVHQAYEAAMAYAKDTDTTTGQHTQIDFRDTQHTTSLTSLDLKDAQQSKQADEKLAELKPLDLKDIQYDKKLAKLEPLDLTEEGLTNQLPPLTPFEDTQTMVSAKKRKRIGISVLTLIAISIIAFSLRFIRYTQNTQTTYSPVTVTQVKPLVLPEPYSITNNFLHNHQLIGRQPHTQLVKKDDKTQVIHDHISKVFDTLSNRILFNSTDGYYLFDDATGIKEKLPFVTVKNVSAVNTHHQSIAGFWFVGTQDNTNWVAFNLTDNFQIAIEAGAQTDTVQVSDTSATFITK